MMTPPNQSMIAKRFGVGMMLLCTAACASTPEPSAEFYDAMGIVDESTQLIEDGDYVSSAWISDTFDGRHTRDLVGNRLYFTVENLESQSGGWDGSVSHSEEAYGGVPVDDVGDGAVACTAYHVDMERPEGSSSKWWAGPKISVNWASMEDSTAPGDWYENYVIETGSESPEEWERGMRSWIEVDLFAENKIAGSRYKHYKIRFKDWWQFWSIRQDQRAAGAVPVKAILETWKQNGLPGDLLVDGVKANIETYGPMTTEGQISASFNEGGLRAETGSCDVPLPNVPR